MVKADISSRLCKPLFEHNPRSFSLLLVVLVTQACWKQRLPFPFSLLVTFALLFLRCCLEAGSKRSGMKCTGIQWIHYCLSSFGKCQESRRRSVCFTGVFCYALHCTALGCYKLPCMKTLLWKPQIIGLAVVTFLDRRSPHTFVRLPILMLTWKYKRRSKANWKHGRRSLQGNNDGRDYDLSLRREGHRLMWHFMQNKKFKTMPPRGLQLGHAPGKQRRKEKRLEARKESVTVSATCTGG